ncbi:hypothetical protein G6F48_003634 [Rhizopus delemar]|nr:hypothetical protein G6F48_003634 [Rhizopus delemar]
MSDKEYFWGPATSTIDWCEENYHVSPYLAEFFNTTTNLMFMIYVASIMVWHIFKADPNHKKNYKLPLILAIYSAIITYSYLIIKNPVFHQVSYALLVFTIVFKSISLQLTVPSVNYEKSKLEKLLWFSALGFIVAFIVWNIDNQFCTYLRAWRHSVSFIMGSFSELHGWWHIGTGIKKSLSCKPNSNISKRSEPTTLSSIVNGSSKY